MTNEIPHKRLQIYDLSINELLIGLKETKHKKEYIKYVSKYRIEFFILYFFQEYLLEGFSPMHEYIFNLEEDHYIDQLIYESKFQDRRTYKDALAAPRGHAKSTMETLFKPLWAMLQNPPLEQYIMIISNTHDQAKDRLRDIKKELEGNYYIKYVYGIQEGDVWSDKKLTTRNGVRVQIASAESSIRGAREGWSRPSLIILDDIENEKNVTTEHQRTQMKDWFNKEVMKLGAKYTNFSFVGTILHNESLLRKTLDNPMWNGMVYKALIQEPTNSELWKKWKALLTDAGDDNRKQTANEFYKNNEKELLEGAVLLWEEHESLKDLQEMRLAEGEYSFQAEKQNNPIDPESQIFDTKNDWQYFNIICQGAYSFIQDNTTQSLVALHECQLFAWLDPSTGATGGDPDYASISVVARYQNFIFWLDSWMKKCSTYEQVEQIFIISEKWYSMGFPINAFGIESNNFQKLFLQDVQRRRTERQQDNEFYDVYPHGIHQQANKQNRIISLQPKFKNGWIKVNNTISPHIIAQFEAFNIGKFKVHDDGPDALEGAFKLAKKYSII